MRVAAQRPRASTASHLDGLRPSCAAGGTTIDADVVHICISCGTATKRSCHPSQQIACGVGAGLEKLCSPVALLCELFGRVAALLIKEQHHTDAHGASSCLAMHEDDVDGQWPTSLTTST